MSKKNKNNKKIESVVAQHYTITTFLIAIILLLTFSVVRCAIYH